MYEHVHAGRLGGWRHLVQAHHRDAAAALVGVLSAGVIDEDLAHQLRRHRKEVRPALQRHAVHIHESQVDLMDERRRLQGVPGGSPGDGGAPRGAARHTRAGSGGRAPRRLPGARTGAVQLLRARGAVRHRLVRGKSARLRFYLTGPKQASRRQRFVDPSRHAGTNRQAKESYEHHSHSQARHLVGRSNRDAAPGVSRHGTGTRRPESAHRSDLHEVGDHVPSDGGLLGRRPREQIRRRGFSTTSERQPGLKAASFGSRRSMRSRTGTIHSPR